MRSAKKKIIAVVGMILCAMACLYFFTSNPSSSRDNLVEGCRIFDQGVNSGFLWAGLTQYRQYNNETGSTVSLVRNVQNESLENEALLEVCFYIKREFVDSKPFEDDSISTLLDNLLSLTFDLTYKKLTDDTFELKTIEICPQKISEYTLLEDICITIPSLGTQGYGEPLKGTINMHFNDIGMNLSNQFEWEYEITIKENDRINLILTASDYNERISSLTKST